MGDWAYYVALMSLADVKERIGLANEIHTSATLNEFIQRRVTARTDNIRDYLLDQPQHLFSSLVVGVYGGSPDWYELNVGRNAALGIADIPEEVEGALGILVLQGNERLFALDGQHRLVGIKKALDEQPNLGGETVSTVFVGHRTDEAGMTRTRRLFTTLNRYAKPISALDKIAMDEDDIVAIVTRRMVDNYPLFRGRIPALETKPIPASDRASVTTLASLYDSLDRYLRPTGMSGATWAKRKRFRPNDEDLDAAYKGATDLFDTLASALEPLRLLSEGQPTEDVVPRFRNREAGGHLVLRPVGLGLVVEAVRAFVEHGETLEGAARRVGAVPMALNGEPWVGVLWEPAAHRMITSSQNLSIARWILLYGAGGDLSWLGTRFTPDRARRELTGVLFPEDPQHEPVALRRYAAPLLD